jgi:RNA polymerase sigma-70 factor (ECF subfamily)
MQPCSTIALEIPAIPDRERRDFFLALFPTEEASGFGAQAKETSLDVEDLYRRYGPMVLRRCRWMLRDESWARDAMQDVFVQLLRRQDVLTVDHPSSLLHRMSTNICLNLLRSRKRRPEDSDDELLMRIASADDHGRAIEARSVLDRLFGREKESTRTIAVMHLLDGYTLEEVARETGLSVSGVRKRLRALRAHVRELEAL